jgi:hypothetical protein
METVNDSDSNRLDTEDPSADQAITSLEETLGKKLFCVQDTQPQERARVGQLALLLATGWTTEGSYFESW